MFTAILETKSGITNFILMRNKIIVATGAAKQKDIKIQKVSLEPCDTLPTFIEAVYDHHNNSVVLGHIEEDLFIGEDTKTYKDEDADIFFSNIDENEDLSKLDSSIDDLDYPSDDY